MAINALRACMLPAGYREVRVVEPPLEPVPIGPSVAQLTVGRKTSSYVIRIGRGVVVVQVTVHAVGR